MQMQRVCRVYKWPLQGNDPDDLRLLVTLFLGGEGSPGIPSQASYFGEIKSFNPMTLVCAWRGVGTGFPLARLFQEKFRIERCLAESFCERVVAVHMRTTT